MKFYNNFLIISNSIFDQPSLQFSKIIATWPATLWGQIEHSWQFYGISFVCHCFKKYWRTIAFIYFSINHRWEVKEALSRGRFICLRFAVLGHVFCGFAVSAKLLWSAVLASFMCGFAIWRHFECGFAVWRHSECGLFSVSKKRMITGSIHLGKWL